MGTRVCKAGVGRLPLSAVAALCLLAGCGRTAQAPSAAGASGLPGAKLTPKTVDGIDPDMVSAVTNGGSSIVGIKFRLMSKPTIGMPLQVKIALLPAPDVAITHMHVSFQTGDGLQLQSEHTLDVDDPHGGVPLEQTLIVVPTQAGVLNLNATVVIEQDAASLARTYTIPLIAGAS